MIGCFQWEWLSPLIIRFESGANHFRRLFPIGTVKWLSSFLLSGSNPAPPITIYNSPLMRAILFSAAQILNVEIDSRSITNH